MSVTMSKSPNRLPAAGNNFEEANRNTVINRFTDFDVAAPADQEKTLTQSLGKGDLFFDSSSQGQAPAQQSDSSLVDSFTLFNSSEHLSPEEGLSTSAVTSQLYNPIVFNQQFSQFQRATNGGKYFPPYTRQQHATEITEANVDDDDDEDNELGQNYTGRVFVQEDEDRKEQNSSAANELENDQSLYENYMIDYDADYDQFYDPNAVHYHQQMQLAGRGGGQHYTVEEEGEVDEEPFEYYSNENDSNVNGENDVNLDMVVDAKTYGLMLPPYHHFKQLSGNQSHQMHPQFQMIQHPYMYGNPFSYNLHTIIEESENESSLQTLSSVTSSNFQSLQFDQMNTPSLTPTNGKRPKRRSSQQMGELSDPSLSSHSSLPSSESSPSVKEKFSGKLVKSSHSHSHHPHHLHDSHQRSSGENFSEISFTSSSTFSENGSDAPEERSDEDEDETFQVVTANTNLTELITDDLQNSTSEPDPTTSKLERYFTSSLLEANSTNNKLNHPKIEPHSMSLTPTSLSTIKAIAPVVEQNNSNTQTKSKLTRQQALIKYKLVKLKYTLRSLLLDANFRQLTLEQINQLNYEFFRSDWIVLLKSIINRNLKRKIVLPALLTKVYYVFRLQFSSSKLRQHIVDYLVDHIMTTSAVNIVRTHQLAGKFIFNAKNITHKAPYKAISSHQKENGYAKSKIQITINEGQSMIIIKNESTADTAKIPSIPCRAKKEVKLKTIQSKRLQQTQIDSLEDNKMIYRTVLQVNDVNGLQYQNEFSKVDDRLQNKRISKLLNQSNPLNRNFLVKSMLNDNAESEEKSKQHSEIYGWIQRAPSETEQLYTTLGDESERSAQKPKNKSSNLLNSSTQLLLGSLRSRSKDRFNWNGTDGNTSKHANNGGKFKTISGNVHSKASESPLTSDGVQSNYESKFKLERSQKGSKSFRDQRPSPTTATPSNQATTAWDSIYGGGMKLLKNISFVRKRNRSSVKEEELQHNLPSTCSSSESSAEESDGAPSRDKSFSEPNLHKSNRPSRQRAKTPTTQGEESGNIYETLRPQQAEKQSSSKSTPHLISRSTSREGQQYADKSGQLNERVRKSSSAMSTPSLLYRLSNPVPCPGSSMSMRSISTSSLRTRRSKNYSHSAGKSHLSTAHNGEWQKMSSTIEENLNQGLTTWTRKPSSLRVVSSETSTVNVQQNTKNAVTSSHYHRQEIVEQIKAEMPKEAVKGATTLAVLPLLSTPLVQTVTSEALASSQTMGELSLALNYEMRIGTLEILINKCRINAIRPKVDLYVKVYLLPDRSKSSKRKTRVVKAHRSTTGRSPAGQLHAEFNETLRFTGPFGEFTGRRIWLSIWSNDKFGRNEPIAEMVLGPLDSSLLSSGHLGTITWYRLVEPISTNPKPIQTSDSTRLPVESLCDAQFYSTSLEKVNVEYTGTIFLAIKYQNDAEPVNSVDYQHSFDLGSLHILIKEAQNLQFNITAANVIGSTFCKLTFLPERSKQDREKSSFIKCPLEYSSNPRWNQTFVFQNVTADDLQQRLLEITVWFQSEHAMQKSGKKLFVGGVRLSANTSESTPNEVNLWNQLLDRHNMWAYGEIPLRQIDCTK